MSLRFCADVASANWIVDSKISWKDLVTLGPPGFECYAQVRSESEDLSDPADLVTRICCSLLSATTMPQAFYFCLWAGWPGFVAPEPGGPRIAIGDRDYHLFTGDISNMGEWRGKRGYVPPAAFTWPHDRSWIVTYDVDADWVGVAGTESALQMIDAPDVSVHLITSSER